MEIKEAVLQVLDLEASSLLCSQQTLTLTDYPVKTYLNGIVKKFEKGDLKIGTLNADHAILQLINREDLNFVEKGQELSQIVFDCLVQGQEVLSGDILCMIAEREGQELFGFVKLNYKPAYTHYVDYEGDLLLNNLIINKTILPALTQKVEEAFFINVKTGDFELVEKKYLFDGKKANYLSDIILKTAATPTIQDNIKIVKKAVKEIADKYNEEKYVSMSQIQQAVHESLEEEGKISNEKIAEAVFENNHVAKTEYLERVEQTDFVEDIPVNVPKYEKKYSKQKLKLANGIEMIIPVDVYQDKDLIEFINNPDGTISVMIKNVDEIVNKF